MKKSAEEQEKLQRQILKRRIEKRERRNAFLEKAKQRSKAFEMRLRNKLRGLDDKSKSESTDFHSARERSNLAPGYGEKRLL
jgi:hypothetical protein